MQFDRLIIWFVEGAFAPELDRRLVEVIGRPQEWSNWRVIADLTAIEKELDAIELAPEFPDAVLIHGCGNDGGRLHRALRDRCADFRKADSAYQLIETDGETIAMSVTHVLRKAVRACEDAARYRLVNGDCVIPKEASALLWDCAHSVKNALDSWSSARSRYAELAAPAIREIVGRIRLQQETGMHGYVPFRDLLAAENPMLAELALRRGHGELARFASSGLSEVLSELRQFADRVELDQAELVARDVVERVWRVLEGSDFYRDLWHLAPFDARRLWRHRDSVVFMDTMLDCLNSMCRLLEESVPDYTMALTRLFKSIRVNERSVRTTVFAHMLHSWSRPLDFEMQFGCELPQDDGERERLLRIELDGPPDPEIPSVSRVKLPPETRMHIEKDAKDRGGGIGGVRLLKFASTRWFADWLVVPAVYLSESGDWADILRCPIEVVRDIEKVGTMGVPEEAVLADWRLLRDLVKLLKNEVEGQPLAARVVYSPDTKYVTLDFDFCVPAHLGMPKLNTGKGSANQALRDLLPWCHDVRVHTNDMFGQCYEAAGPSFVPKEIEMRRADPFMKLSLSIPHYNHTRGAD